MSTRETSAEAMDADLPSILDKKSILSVLADRQSSNGGGVRRERLVPHPARESIYNDDNTEIQIVCQQHTAVIGHVIGATTGALASDGALAKGIRRVLDHPRSRS